MIGRAWRMMGAVGAGIVAAPSAWARIEHVVQISVDGLRGDALHEWVTAPGSTYGGFRRLQDEGASTYNARCDFSNSETVPNHCGMVTGRPVASPAGVSASYQHGFTENSPAAGDTIHQQGLPPGYKASAFDRVHDRGLKTALLLSKLKLAVLNTSYDATHGAIDEDGIDNGRDKIDQRQIQDGATPTLIARLVEWMDAGFPHYTFLHLVDPDVAGHTAGWGTLTWKAAVKTTDDNIGALLAALDARPALKATTAIILTADHGGGGSPTAHADATRLENVTVPFFIRGPGVPPGRSAFALLDDRYDPGATRPPDGGTTLPLRDTDAPNLAMALLGLPPIAGSYFKPTLHADLTARRESSDIVIVSWPLYLTGHTLEASDSLRAGSWTPVEAGLVEAGSRFVFTESASGDSPRFFRLRPPK